LDTPKTNHSHEDALADREFERLLEGCKDLPSPRDFEARVICLLAGRLGLRAGEVTHFQQDWIDFDRDLISIPQFRNCDCGSCRRQAKREAERADDLDLAQAVDERWQPKTAAAARVIPFDISLRIELCLDRFAERHESFPRSRATVNRRVNAAAEATNLAGNVYPHSLRATAASFHAYRGVTPVPLQALMGWRDLSTAQKYIRISGSATAKAIRNVHH
jgi:integrase